MLHKLIDSFSADYAFLSNFYHCRVCYEGGIFPTAEHAFQFAKTLDPASRHLISVAPTAGQAKRLGRKVPLRSDWEQIKVQVMTDILRYKFSSHVRLREELLLTQDAMLVEGNTWHDNFWGDCKCARCRRTPGENKLGIILMQLREEFNNERPR